MGSTQRNNENHCTGRKAQARIHQKGRHQIVLHHHDPEAAQSTLCKRQINVVSSELAIAS